MCTQDLNAGNIPGIAEARELYQADLVQMIIEASEYCGYVLPHNCIAQYYRNERAQHNVQRYCATEYPQVETWCQLREWRHCCSLRALASSTATTLLITVYIFCAYLQIRQSDGYSYSCIWGTYYT
jgi:hypothetical protein